MATVDLSAISYLLKDVIVPAVFVSHAQNNELLDYPTVNKDRGDGLPKLNGLIPKVPSGGGSTLKWGIEYASDGATEISEGDALPAPGGPSLVQASQGRRYFAATLKITRQAIDDCRDMAAVVNLLQYQLDSKMRAFFHTLNTTFLGTGTGNIQAIIDETTTYAGVSSRSTYKFDSYESAVDGAIAVSDGEDAIEELVVRGANYRDLIWVVPHGQVTNISRLAGVTGNAQVQKYVETGGAFDPSFLRDQISFGGVPVRGVNGLTSTVMLLMNPRTFEWRIHKDLIVEPKETQDYSYSWFVLMALFLRCTDPYTNGKLTGVTA